MKKNATSSKGFDGDEKKSITKNLKKEINPIAKKGPAKRGGSIAETEEADVEEFEEREEIAKKAAETESESEEEARGWRKINRISDSGVRDDDDDGADADIEDIADGTDG